MNEEYDSPLLRSLQHDPAWMRRPSVEKALRNLPLIVLVGSLFLLYGFFLAHKIDLVTADLGRHIKNGEILLQDTSVLERNFYSYTHPDFPVINHHWGSGVLFYIVWKLSGFVGVQLFFILLSLAALAVFLASARLYSPWGLIGLAALPAVFLLGERTEIRPEVLSYLFAGLFFLVLCRYRESFQGLTLGTSKVSPWRTLWLLPVIQVLWVNTHIYFLLGPLLIGAFLLESILVRRQQFLKLFWVFVATIGATFINPFGYRAVTGALTLFENFGYRLAENQSIWFLERLGMVNPNFLIFKILFGVLVLSYLFAIYRSWRRVRLSHIFVAAGVGTLALLASRNMTLFGFFFIPLVAAHTHTAFGDRFPGRSLRAAALLLVAVTLLLSIAFTLPRYFPYWRSFGFGLEAGNSKAAEFLKKESIRGPYFNNYDIGGYLIFHRFPEEKVFVDNRPEAYPATFFTGDYIPMQEDDEKWREALSRRGFNAIVFAHLDATPWGQAFLRSRLDDAAWAPVFVDERVLVLLRKTEENVATITTFEIPRETFVFR